MMNCGVITPFGEVTDPKAMKTHVSGLLGDEYVGTAHEFIRKTGVTRHITTLPAVVFRKQLVSDIDWQRYVTVSPIYSHSMIFLHAFRDARFVLVDKPWLSITVTQDNEFRWVALGRAQARSVYYPWALGMCRHVNTLLERGVIDAAWFHDAVEVGVRLDDRYTLHGHTLFVLNRQMASALTTMNTVDLPTEEEWEEIVPVFHLGDEKSQAMIRALGEMLSIIRPLVRARQQEREGLLGWGPTAESLGRALTLLDAPARERLSEVVRNWASATLESWLPRITWQPPELIHEGVEQDYLIYSFGDRWFAIRTDVEVEGYAAMGPLEDGLRVIGGPSKASVVEAAWARSAASADH
jgi:hypothetical protein